MKKRTILVAAIALVVLLAIAYRWSPASVPAGQEPLVVLSNEDLHEFAAAFDRDEDAARLVLLLSPT